MSNAMRVVAYVLMAVGFGWYLISMGVMIVLFSLVMIYRNPPFFDSDVLNLIAGVVGGAWISAPYSLPGLLAGVAGFFLLRWARARDIRRET
jgi:hypothetical protein